MELTEEKRAAIDEACGRHLPHFSHTEIAGAMAEALLKLTGVRYSLRITSWVSPNTWPEEADLHAIIKREIGSVETTEP